MEYADNGDLTQKIKKVKNEGKTFSEDEILSLIAQMALGI